MSANEVVVKEVREKMKKKFAEMKRDLYIEIMDKYPVVKDFVENPRPFSVATFAGYLKLIKSDAKVPERLKNEILQLQDKYLEMLNEKLAKAGLFDYKVVVNDAGYTYLVDVITRKSYKLGFNDIMNIYGGRNLDKIIEIIIAKAEGRYYNTKYYSYDEDKVDEIKRGSSREVDGRNKFIL